MHPHTHVSSLRVPVDFVCDCAVSCGFIDGSWNQGHQLPDASTNSKSKVNQLSRRRRLGRHIAKSKNSHKDSFAVIFRSWMCFDPYFGAFEACAAIKFHPSAHTFIGCIALRKSFARRQKLMTQLSKLAAPAKILVMLTGAVR